MGVGNSNSRSSANSSDVDNKRRYYSNPSNLGNGRPASSSQSNWGLSGRNSNSSSSSGVRSYSNPGSSSSALLVDLTIHQAQLIQDLQDHQQWVVRHEVHLHPLLVQVVEVLDSN